MYITIVAVCYEDGLAYLKHDNKYYYCVFNQPDFLNNQVEEHDVMIAVNKHGFQAVNLNYPDQSGVLSNLRESYKEKHGREIYQKTNKSILYLIKNAPKEKVLEFLDKVENEIISNEKLEPSYRLLQALLSNRYIKHNQELINKCNLLINLILEKIRQDK